MSAKIHVIFTLWLGPLCGRYRGEWHEKAEPGWKEIVTVVTKIKKPVGMGAGRYEHKYKCAEPGR